MRASAVVACLSMFACASARAGLDVSPDMSGYAKRDQIPAASSSVPAATSLDSGAGSAETYARSDHTHAARVQRTVVITDNSGNATWTFARPIVVQAGKLPPVTFMVEDASTDPVIVQITGRTFTSSGGLDTHTAVTVKAQRSRTLPATLTAVAALANYAVFGSAAVAVRVNLFAADPTQ